MGIRSSPASLSSSAPEPYKPTAVAKREASAHDYTSNVCWFDIEDDRDSEDGSISPISDQSSFKSGTRWTRFFPELSSNFSLVSPVSTITPTISLSLSETLPNNDPVRHAPDEVGQKLGCSWLSSNEPDSASSCYSRRSSVTSLGSELAGFSYKSADAFSIMSPIAAGVFDDPASIRGDHSHFIKKTLSTTELKDKPLPLEPVIQLAPLSVRRRQQSPQNNEYAVGDDLNLTAHTPAVKHQYWHRPTLSTAAEDLKNTLAGVPRHQKPLPTPYHMLDKPLQISRGNMDMIPSRPAPKPPVDPERHQQMQKVKLYDEGKSKKKTKVPFGFSLPGFSKKDNHLHSRSLSISNMRSEMKLSTSRGEEDSDSKEPRSRDDMTGLPRFPNPSHSQEPFSTTIGRELRLQLPRLQTKDAEYADQTNEETETVTEAKPKECFQLTEEFKTFFPKNKLDSYTFSEKFFVSTTKIIRPVSGDSPDRIDMAQAPEMIYELEGGIPALQDEHTISGHEPTLQTPANLPDEVVLSLLHQVCSLNDLFHLALISKQFYHVFKEHELILIKRAVFTMSPPAWELREMSPPWNSEWQILVDPDTPVPEYTPALYLQHYAQDIYTLAQLKSLILTRCETFLRPDTIRGLAGKDDVRAAEVDDAFWRIWTFCRIFGCGKSREGDIIGQVDWLDGGATAVNNYRSGAAASVTEPFGMQNVLFEPPTGFGRGNKGRLSHDELYNMTEIWTCLGVLLQPLLGRCKEAREAGVFAGHGVSEDNTASAEAVLEEWTYYVITLGPSAVLNLATIGPGGCAATFRRAQSIGLTKWDFSESGASRSSFFKEAVSKAYKPQYDSPVPGLSDSSSQYSGSFTSRGAISPTSMDPSRVKAQQECHRRRQVAYAEQLRIQRRQPLNLGIHSFEDERPTSKYSLIMSRLEGLPYEQHPPLPAPGMMASYVARCAPPTNHYAPKSRPPLPMYHPQVRDPVDQAIDLMVRELGFKEDDVKWALKVTDTGEGINANAAVSLLFRERQKFELQNTVASVPAYRSNSLLSSVIRSPESLNSVWRWA